MDISTFIGVLVGLVIGNYIVIPIGKRVWYALVPINGRGGNMRRFICWLSVGLLLFQGGLFTIAFIMFYYQPQDVWWAVPVVVNGLLLMVGGVFLIFWGGLRV